jgi:hypothetical protein
MRVLKLSLITKEQRTGTQILTGPLAETDIIWDAEDGDDPTEMAVFEVTDLADRVLETCAITGDEWRTLESEGNLDVVAQDVTRGIPLTDAIESQLCKLAA